MINKSLEKNKYKLNENDLFLEFSVFKGESLNFFSSKLNTIHQKFMVLIALKALVMIG